MTATTSSLSELLYPGLEPIYGTKIDQWKEEYSRFIDIERSDRNYNSYQEMIAFGQIPETSNDGGTTTYDDPLQGFKTNVVNKKYTLGFRVSREMHDDDNYAEINKLPAAMAQSVVDTVETLGADLLNNAFSASFLGTDGVSLCSTAHTYGNGTTFANRPATDVDLSMTAFETMKIDLSVLTDGRGKKIKVMPRTMIVSPSFEATAKQILQSDKDPETANNAINPFKNGVDLVVSHFLDDTDSWFVRTDQEGLICQRRVWPFEFRKDNNFDDDVAKFKTYGRLRFDFYNARSIWGTSGGGS